MNVDVYVFVDVKVYVCVYVYVWICICICMYVCICMYMSVYVCIYLYMYVDMYISMRCAPTPPQCPLPSILIAVCVPMSSHCDLYGMCAQHLVAFVKGNYVIFVYEGSL